MRPNIVLITTDQQRYDTLSCNGNEFINTPNLDRLALGGARFTRAYCTNPVCTPSRVSIMTGKYPSAHGSYNIGTVAEPTDQFLSSRLKERGIDSSDYPVHILHKRDAYANGEWELPERVHNSAWIVDRAREFLRSWGKQAGAGEIQAAPSPGIQSGCAGKEK